MRTSADEFSTNTRQLAWKRANGHCEGCGCYLVGKAAHYDHRKPVWAGGDNSLGNCSVLCTYPCHADKTGEESGSRAKANRALNKHANIKRPRQPMPGSRLSKYKRRMDGTVVRRDQ